MKLYKTQTTKHIDKLNAFIKDFANYPMVVRDRVIAREQRIRQLRTKKNNHLAMAFDELGNAFVLCADGFCRQLDLDEENTHY